MPTLTTIWGRSRCRATSTAKRPRSFAARSSCGRRGQLSRAFVHPLLAAEDFVAAEEGARIVLGLAPGSADAHYVLGVALLRRGETQQAIREFESALQIDGGHREAAASSRTCRGRRSAGDRAGVAISAEFGRNPGRQTNWSGCRGALTGGRETIIGLRAARPLDKRASARLHDTVTRSVDRSPTSIPRHSQPRDPSMPRYRLWAAFVVASLIASFAAR